MTWPPDFLRFTGAATTAGLWGAGLLLLSFVAMVGDLRRRRRRDIDRVGWVPWRDISALTAFAGVVLLAAAASSWVKG